MHATILFAHGARDARWAEPFQKVLAHVRAHRPHEPVELAFLEFMQPGLDEAVRRIVEQGAHTIHVLPIFLGQGGHVLRDVPAMLEALTAQYPACRLQLHPAIGENAEVIAAIAGYCLSCLPDA